jgi:S-DNA-T family DNA segregation ATPase FtsK/SpoIIIE
MSFRLLCSTAAAVARWPARHWRYSALWLLVLAAARSRQDQLTTTALTALVVPAVVAGVWSSCWPASFERWVAGPHRRWVWRRWTRRAWPGLARECGLAVLRDGRDGQKVWLHPRLSRPRTSGDTLTLRISARAGQTIEHLEAAAAAIGTAARAVSWRTRPGPPGVLVLDLVMRDLLAHSRTGRMPVAVQVDRLDLGRRQDGTRWVLPIRGRHTLVVGCSGSGKGSILWGIAAGLAPAVAGDTARLWGVDLKRGVEIGMGASLFTTVATTPDDAVRVLRRLLAVIDERGAVMAGRSRLHEPAAGDPLHVLVVDELAALTAYADGDTRRDGSRLLSEILTQGRALGVVVVACVQDPRKETVGMRGLFTQTVALRLRSAEETRMVLGDGTAATAPAHRVSPSAPGCGWLVEDDGAADRVRADHWPDPLVQAVAQRYPAPVLEQPQAPAPHPSRPPKEPQDATPEDAPATDTPAENMSATVDPPRAPRPRKPRSPRTPRTRSAGAPARDERGRVA